MIQIKGWDNRRRNWSCYPIARAFQLGYFHNRHEIEVIVHSNCVVFEVELDDGLDNIGP